MAVLSARPPITEQLGKQRSSCDRDQTAARVSQDLRRAPQVTRNLQCEGLNSISILLLSDIHHVYNRYLWDRTAPNIAGISTTGRVTRLVNARA